MPGKNITIKLTDEQRAEILKETGKKLTELHIELSPTGQLSEEDLGRVAGGWDWIKIR